MDSLRIHLFGVFQVVHGDLGHIPKITPKEQALLAYLLLHGPRSHPREIIVDQFWGDSPPERGRGCLSTTLWRLRSTLESDSVAPGTYLITKPGGEIGFNWACSHWLDVKVFENRVDPILAQPFDTVPQADIKALESLLPLYRGDLLEGFYDDWVIRKQEKLRSLFLDCLEHLTRYFRYHGKIERSLVYGQQVLDREPLREEIHREMMRSYLQSDRRALAVRQYEICREALATELDLLPMRETQDLYNVAMGGSNADQRHETIPVSQKDLQQALKSLGQVVNDFGRAQHQFQVASQHLAQTQRHLKALQRLIERLHGS